MNAQVQTGELMIKAIARLERQEIEFNLPATADAIAALEAELGTALPQPLKDFYTSHNGISHNGDLWFELSGVEDVLEIYRDLPNWDWYEETPALIRTGIHIGTDIGGNALVYLTLPACPDRIAFIHHESPAEPQVYWGSLQELLEVASMDEGTPTFYPARAGERSDDARAADACIAHWQVADGDEESLFYLSLACNVLPQGRLNELIDWLDTLPLEQLRPVYLSLSKRYRKDQPNEQIITTLEAAMLRAEQLRASHGSDLKWIADAIVSTGSPNALAALLRLGDTMSSGQLIALEGALKKLGARVDRVPSPHGKKRWALSLQFADDGEPTLLIGQPRPPVYQFQRRA